MTQSVLRDLIFGLKQLEEADQLADREVELVYYICVYRARVSSRNQLMDKIGGDLSTPRVDKKGIPHPRNVSRSTVRNHLIPLEKIFSDRNLVLVSEETCKEFSSILPIVNGTPVFTPWPPPSIQEEITDSEDASQENDSIDSIVVGGREDLLPSQEETPDSDPEPIEDPLPINNSTDDAIGRVLTDQNQTQPNPNPQPPTPTPTPPGRQERSNISWLTILLPLVLVSGLGILGFNWIRSRNQLPPDLQATVDVAVAGTAEALPPVQETQIVEQTVAVTVPPNQTEIAEHVVSTVNALPTFTPALATVIVPTTIVVTDMATVEVPVTVEVTSAPTAPPTPLGENLIIEDFEDTELNLPSQPLGTFSIRRGVLHVDAGNFARIEIGDETWKDYTIEYDHLNNCLDSRLSVRKLDEENEATFNYGGTGPRWGWWILTYQGETIDLEVAERWEWWGTHIYVKVSDDQITQTGVQGVKEIPNIEIESGGIVIHSLCGDIDNLRVERIE